jgi:glycosyltransferase involved in cell wall biosynthesis
MVTNAVVSVIIPTWNRAAEVRRAVDSVLAQTYKPLEAIVVDDGSTDGTPKVLASYGRAIRVIRRENGGPSAARNTGIRASTGEAVAWLDSDDCWQPDRVEALAALLNAAGPAVICGLSNSLEHWAGGRTVDTFRNNRFLPAPQEGVLDNPSEILLSRFVLFNPNALVRRAALFDAGLFDESLPVLEDYSLAISLSFAGPWVYTTRRLAVINRGHPNSVTASANRDRRVAARTLVAIYEGVAARHPGLSAREEAILADSLARARSELRRAESGSAEAGVGGFARRLAAAARRRSPFFPKPNVRAITLRRAGS